MVRRVPMAEVSEGRVSFRGVRSEGWCDGGLGQQRDDIAAAR